MTDLTIPRVPSEIPQRLRVFCDKVAAVLNSLVLKGDISLVGQGEWEAGGGTGDFQIGGAVVGGEPYLVLYIGADGTLAQDADFRYDPAHDVLRVPLVAASKTEITLGELPTDSFSFSIEDAEP